MNMEIVDFVKEHPYKCFFIPLDFVLVAVIVFLGVKHFSKNIIMDIDVAPSSATVSVNGREIDSNKGVKAIDLGMNNITVSADGFKTRVVNLEVTEGSIAKVNVYLEPSDANSDYYVKHPEDFELAKEIGGEYVERIENLTSIRSVLPIIKYQYGGLYGKSSEIVIDEDVVSCGKIFCLLITGDFSSNHSLSAELLKGKNYDINNYGVRYASRK